MCTLSISLPAAPLCALPSQIALPRCAIEIEKHDSTIAHGAQPTGNAWESQAISSPFAYLAENFPDARPESSAASRRCHYRARHFGGYFAFPVQWSAQLVGIPSRCGSMRCRSGSTRRTRSVASNYTVIELVGCISRSTSTRCEDAVVIVRRSNSCTFAPGYAHVLNTVRVSHCADH